MILRPILDKNVFLMVTAYLQHFFKIQILVNKVVTTSSNILKFYPSMWKIHENINIFQKTLFFIHFQNLTLFWN